jgi:hypothetical protein
MVDKKGFELAISTVVIFVLGLLVLAGLIYAVNGGFKKFKGGSDPLLNSAEASAVRQACKLSCNSNDKISYCCKNVSIQGMTLKCDDSKLDLGCEINCKDFSCS